jgi:hypothetical protein
LRQFHEWLTAWSVKAARLQDANVKKRLDAQLEVHTCYIKEADERRRKRRGDCVATSELTEEEEDERWRKGRENMRASRARKKMRASLCSS